MFSLSQRSEKNLIGVHTDLIAVIRRAIQITIVDFGVLDGARTVAEQAALYAKGRTAPGPIVTWTMKSRHIGGFAVDLGAYVAGKYINGDTPEELKLYDKIADAVLAAARELNIPVKWGIILNGKRTDVGHFELDQKVYR